MSTGTDEGIDEVAGAIDRLRVRIKSCGYDQCGDQHL
jgi:hypothetical protein